MVIFVAILSVVNIAVGYWLACFLQTGNMIPTMPSLTAGRNFSSQAAPDNRPLDGPIAAAARSESKAPPAPLASPGPPARPAGPAAPASETPPSSASVSPAAAPIPVAATSATVGADPISAALDAADETPAAAEGQDAKAASAPATDDGAPSHKNDAAVEENVLAGIEAFRLQLAAMKEKSSTGSLND